MSDTPKFRKYQVVFCRRWQCFGQLVERGQETLTEGRLWRMQRSCARRYEEWVVEADLRPLRKKERWIPGVER